MDTFYGIINGLDGVELGLCIYDIFSNKLECIISDMSKFFLTKKIKNKKISFF